MYCTVSHYTNCQATYSTYTLYTKNAHTDMVGYMGSLPTKKPFHTPKLGPYPQKNFGLHLYIPKGLIYPPLCLEPATIVKEGGFWVVRKYIYRNGSIYSTTIGSCGSIYTVEAVL